MRLEGSLDAFSLPDIFQLLSFTKKTGGLHLRRDDLHGVVYVTSGSLTGGSSNTGREALARRLIGGGVVDDDALLAAVEAATDAPDVGVARALQQAGHLDDAILHETASEHVIDTVFDLLRWPDGDFEFVVDEANPDDVGVMVSVESVVEEARRRLDAWSQVSMTIPSPEAVLAVAFAPRGDPTLSREEWALLALVDGRRPVVDIVTATGRGEYAVVTALASLVERGLLVVTHDAEPPGVDVLLRRISVLGAIESAPSPTPSRATRQDKPSDETSPEPEATTLAEPTTLAEAFGAPAQREPGRTDEPVDAVVPTRPEPTRSRRRPEHPDDDLATAGALVRNQIEGTAAIADPVLDMYADPAQPAHSSGLIERDPSVNKSLLLRLIAGVRGL